MTEDQGATMDASWAAVARDARHACTLLGYPIESRCLPDESKPCGEGFAAHAAAFLAIIKAVADHQLGHIGTMGGLLESVYWNTLYDLGHDNWQPSWSRFEYTPTPSPRVCNCNGDGLHVHIRPSEN